MEPRTAPLWHFVAVFGAGVVTSSAIWIAFNAPIFAYLSQFTCR